MTVVLLQFGQPLKELYMYLPKVPKLMTISFDMYPFDCLFISLSNFAFCLSFTLCSMLP